MDLMPESKMTIVKKTIKKWPAYSNYVRALGIDPVKVKGLDELPIVCKDFISSSVFSIFPSQIRSIVPSSGSTGLRFSFGVYGDAELKRSAKAIDSFLESRFNTRKKKTLLLNTLPGSAPLYSSSVTVASIGVRADTAFSAIESLGSYYSQVILVGEPLFIKTLIEYGLERSIEWKYIPLFIILGGEWISETYRAYLESIIGPGRVYSSMGMAELGLNYFFETEEMIYLRRLLLEDKNLASLLLYEGIDFCPMLFAYNRDDIYVETVQDCDGPLESILLTTFDTKRILPLIRYKTGDKGKVLSREMIKQALKISGYTSFLDTHGGPVLAHYGRGKSVRRVYPEQVKETIYCSEKLASTTTGNFALGENAGNVRLEIELRKGLQPSAALDHAYCEAFSCLPVEIKTYRFERFPYMLDFERKVRYIREDNNSENPRRKEFKLSA
jgi:phenylacetate-CoA ligase